MQKKPKQKKKICKLCGKTRLIEKGFTCRQCKVGSKPSYWKKKAWDLCSIYNRKKDIDQFTEYGNCCTCLKPVHWKEGDAGHLVAGRGNAVLFDDRGIHLQCKKCNGPGKGEQYWYSVYVVNRYGESILKELFGLKNKTVQYTIEDYKRIAEEYKQKISKL